MHKEYEEYHSLPTEGDLQINERSLPSRKNKHRKPTSFLEKQSFSLIIFILFVLVLGGILLYYYYKDDDKGPVANADNSVEASSSEIGLNEPKQSIDPVEQTTPSTEDVPKFETVPVVEIIEPTKPDEKDRAENSIQNDTVAPIKEVIHIVEENDTLFNISTKYYGTPDFNRIKEANGLKDNNIILGMKLIIPDPLKTP